MDDKPEIDPKDQMIADLRKENAVLRQMVADKSLQLVGLELAQRLKE